MKFRIQLIGKLVIHTRMKHTRKPPNHSWFRVELVFGLSHSRLSGFSTTTPNSSTNDSRPPTGTNQKQQTISFFFGLCLILMVLDRHMKRTQHLAIANKAMAIQQPSTLELDARASSILSITTALLPALVLAKRADPRSCCLLCRRIEKNRTAPFCFLRIV